MLSVKKYEWNDPSKKLNNDEILPFAGILPKKQNEQNIMLRNSYGNQLFSISRNWFLKSNFECRTSAEKFPRPLLANNGICQ